MKQWIILLIFFIYSIFSFGQNFPKTEIHQFFSQATQNKIANKDKYIVIPDKIVDTTHHSGVFEVVEKLKELKTDRLQKKPVGGDTLVIGISPNDSLIVNGIFFHNGPVFVLGNGVLRFKHANATIVGDLYVWGDHAQVTADSSYLYFPQEYFYQRSLIIAGNGKVIYNNITLDHSGLSHNIVLTDSASITENNVTNIGFTTCGLNKAAVININGINQAGEFVIQDQSKLNFHNAKTILLWFHVPEAGTFNYSFPNGDTVQAFSLDNTTAGISGIDYSVQVDSSTDVMWALMPATGSNVSISNSKIRSIGLWFLGHDSIPVSGLVDNSNYIDYTANLSDRYLHLSNSSVLTWSLYPMDTVNLYVTGCIVGEIGSESNCRVTTSDAFVDGSGGYWWATDQTLMIGENCMAVNAIRSSQSAFFIFAYSTLNQGEASAMGNSIMMIVQSQLPGPPMLYDGSCIWYSWLGNPASAFIDTIVPISGSAWIDKTPTSHLMDFGWYRLYWQKSGDTAWYPVGSKIYSEKKDEILTNWDTHGISPGLYYLKLVLSDNTPDSNKTEALNGINLLPKTFGVDELHLKYFNASIFPNPVSENSVVEFYLPFNEQVEITIVDMSGKEISHTAKQFPGGNNFTPLNNTKLPEGTYFCILKSRDNAETVRFIKK
ncbi:MAG: T9SS type A sorting domain-containing protein [Bacteroidales bacterium]